MRILGISAHYHDAAAALVEDGHVVAAAQEERFTRQKYDARFPVEAIRFCLSERRLRGPDLDAVVYYEKPLHKFERILKTFFAIAPRGFRQFVTSVPLWMRERLWIPMEIERTFEDEFGGQPREVLYTGHHEAHAASAFYPSPYHEAAVLCLDGVGEWTTTSLWHGEGATLTSQQEIRFPHSLGLLYSAFTYYCGFRVNSGEYKLMGLAPYGEPRYADLIREHLIDVQEDGSFRLALPYFGYLHSGLMTTRRFHELFGGPPRAPEAPLTRKHADLAASVQTVTEEVVLRLARHAAAMTGSPHLCLAGGVALNCVANGKIVREGIFRRVWVQPAAGDAGGALGAALRAYHVFHDKPRKVTKPDGMRGSALGPAFSSEQIHADLDARGIPARRLVKDERALFLAEQLAAGKVLGVLQGRMEYGPRALGYRSILGDPRSAKMQSLINRKVKFRESFRPFAPMVLAEDAAYWFELGIESPYMLLVAPVREEHRQLVEAVPTIEEQLHQARSVLPAITHIDYSARIQTVDTERNPFAWELLSAFKVLTGTGVLINTSFNVRGEPIVCTPADALNCFTHTHLDGLLLEDWYVDRETAGIPFIGLPVEAMLD